ncbi:hypothetical protein [Cellulomonas aerilata]|uniref:Uncharacterized protein n=1 Tax=Cellulomonas aerilata TaxID=515326 RepID=A0A512D7P9_9CELL|nr:hypothetical protein [Cellulomonas aerilata]GEO32522.1 hypothetical protein CAE01nite_02470 [Cellulomonas aerilata]
MRDDADRPRAAVMPDDDPPLDPAGSAALIAAQRARVAAETDVDGRLLFGVWGAAWLLGFGALWAVAGDRPALGWSPAAAGVLFAGLLVAAMVVTSVHVARRTSGVHGTSSLQGAMYGWAWFLGFVAVFALASGLTRAGAGAGVVQVAMTLVPPLLVGVLYMAGAAIWRDRAQFALGAWILVVTIVASFVGTPGMLAVMSLAGGGGMLAAAVAEAVRRRS